VRDYVPRHVQRKMRDHIIEHNRCNVFATPGTGKTGGTLDPLLLLKVLGSNFFPALILAPKRVAVDVWPREVGKWKQFHENLRVQSLAGHSEKDRFAMLKRAEEFDATIVNYDVVQWLVEAVDQCFDVWPFKTVVADESTKLKSFRLRNGGKRATALARISKHVGRWINLTGTPAPKGLIDLWGQLWFVDRGERLGRTFGEFKQRYFDENVYSGEIALKPGADELIARAIADVTLTIEAKDYFDLPPIIKNDVYVDLSPKAMALYRRMEDEMYAELENGKAVEAMQAATASMKCLQMASGAVYTEEGNYEEFDDSKLDALASIVDEAAGQPVLVAYHWRFSAERLKRRFSNASDIRASRSIDDWNAGEISVGLIHPASAGHGIDLAVGGNSLVFADQWWDVEQYLQVIERLGPTRQAQHNLNRPVFLHHLIARDTLDESVMARRESRLSIQTALMQRTKRI
jgi:SNF2 family DNA or RNA helicase